jgi:SAM-dependent methyltransferase
MPMHAAAADPRPAVMPLDREAWFKELNLCNFVNSYYQYRDVLRCVGEHARVLVIGPGQGLDTAVLRWRGCEVTTFDIDETFRPDVIGSCHSMPMFSDQQFDVVIASHVLEHLPLPYLDAALAEISRIGRFAVFYLPVAGRHSSLRLSLGVKGIDWSAILDVFRFWHRPTGLRAAYSGGQHFWEIGYSGFRVKDLKRRFVACYEIVDAYRNKDWLPSYNFVLKSRWTTAARKMTA